MARPAKHEDEKRTEQLPPVRVTSAEFLHVKSQAEKAGMSVTNFVRELALHGKVTPQKSKLDASFLVELNRIGVNLNQIAHAQNIGRNDSALLRYALDELVMLMKKIDEAL